MTSSALANLANIRKLKAEPSSLREFEGLLRSAMDRAQDAQNASLSLASRFTLAYDDPQRLRVQIYLSEPAKEQFARLIAENKLTGGEFVQ